MQIILGPYTTRPTLDNEGHWSPAHSKITRTKVMADRTRPAVRRPVNNR